MGRNSDKNDRKTESEVDLGKNGTLHDRQTILVHESLGAMLRQSFSFLVKENSV